MRSRAPLPPPPRRRRRLAKPNLTSKTLPAAAALHSAFPNCTAKLKGDRAALVGPDVSAARDVGALSLRRPVDRGYVVAWDLQREIWARALRKLLPPVAPARCGLVLSEPYLNLPALREAALSAALDGLGFASVLLAPPAELAAAAHFAARPELPASAARAALVLDVGFSYAHAAPVFDGRLLAAAVRRLDLGGKALTNYMKELVSYRSINLMDEAHLLERIKEKVAFVSANVAADLAAARRRDSPHRLEWLLPDGVTSTWGRRRAPGEPRGPKDPVLTVNNERFMVPEALFHPADIGVPQAGLAELAAAAAAAAHPHLRGLLWSNVLIVGGCARMPGFRERLEAELRPLAPDDYELGVFLAEEPANAAWRGGALLGASPEYAARAVTREEWRADPAAAAAKVDA